MHLNTCERSNDNIIGRGKQNEYNTYSFDATRAFQIKNRYALISYEIEFWPHVSFIIKETTELMFLMNNQFVQGFI